MSPRKHPRVAIGAFALWLATTLAAQVTDFGASMVRTPGAPSRVLYAVVGGGLFRSADAGANWSGLYLTEAGLPQPVVNEWVIDPSNAAVLYVSTSLAAGGLWKSSDGGGTWTRANTGLPAGEGAATQLTLNSAQPQTLYVKVGSLLYKTLNGGASWTRQSTLPGSGNVFTVHPTNPMRMYYADSRGSVFRTLDEGATWTQTGAVNLFGDNLTNPVFVTGDPLDQSTVYVCVRGSLLRVGDTIVAGLHRSGDGGATFRPVRSGQPWRIHIDPNGRPFLYETTLETSNVCRSPDRGQRWDCVETASGPGGASLTIDPGNPDVLYAAVSNRGIYRSTNAGDSYSKLEGRLRPTLARPDNPFVFRLQAGDRGSLPFSARLVELPAAQVPYTASTTGESWLTLTNATGNTPATITVNTTTGELSPGVYRASIRLASSQTTNESVTVPVELTVSPRSLSGPQYRISTFAGNGTSASSGDGGPAAAAALRSPLGLALDPSGNLYIVENVDHMVRRVAPGGTIARFAGTGVSGGDGDGGPATAAQLDSPERITVSREGNVFLSERFRNRVRMVSGGTITTVASSNNRINNLPFSSPRGMSPRPDGRIGVVYLGGIAVVTPPGGVTAAFLAQPALSNAQGLAIDSAGSYYVADTGSHRVLKVDAEGRLTTLAGTGLRGFTGDSAQAATTALAGPEGVAVDAEGNVYIADTGNHRIRVVTPDGAIRTIAGTGTAGFAGDGGPASEARLSAPRDVVVDREGNLFVSDNGNRRVRRLERVPAPVPQVADGSFVNAADGSPRLSPGALFSLFGADLSLGEGLVDAAPWPTDLAAATVTINNRLAPLYFNNGRQINGQVPYEIQPGPASVRVDVAGSRSREIRAAIIPAAPGILQFGDRRAVAVNPDGAVNTSGNPIAPGQVLLVYLSGIGAVDNPVPTGAAASASPLSRPMLSSSATLGHREVQLLFLGLAPGFVGLAQANLLVPDLPPGDYLLIITVNGVSSNAVFVTIG